MSKYFNKMIFDIHSEERESGTNSDFMMTLNIPPDKDVNRAVILDAVIKRSWYLIEDGNNTFTLSENGTDVIITIPEGNYNFTSFRITIVNLLNTNSPNGWTYSVSIPNPSIEASTAKYTFNCSGGDPVFIFGDYLYEQMGFLGNSQYTFSSGKLTSVSPVYFNKDVLHIHSDMIADHQSNRMLTVSANGSDFSSIKYQCTDIEAYSKPITKRSNSFQFMIMDEQHKPLKLSLNVSFTLMLYKEYEFDDQFYKMAVEYMKYRLMSK